MLPEPDGRYNSFKPSGQALHQRILAEEVVGNRLSITKPQQNVELEDAKSGNTHNNETGPPSGNNSERLESQVVADEHQSEHSSLGTDVSHQSRGVSRLVVDEHQSTVNPLATRVYTMVLPVKIRLRKSHRCSTQAAYRLTAISPSRLTR